MRPSRPRFQKNAFEGFVEMNVRMWGRETIIEDKFWVSRLGAHGNKNTYKECG